jgi:putative hydrolase of the HAD superfamily
MEKRATRTAPIDFSRVKLLIIDLDNTLCDTHGTLTPAQWNIVADDMRKQGLDTQAKQLLGQLGKTGFAATVKTLALTDKQLVRAVRTFSRVDVTPLRLFPDALPLLKLPITKVLVTRGERNVQSRKLKHLGILKLVDKVYVVPTFSKKRDYLKQALTDFNVWAADALVIGDRVQEEIIDGNGLQIPTILVRRKGWRIAPGVQPTMTTWDLRTIAQGLANAVSPPKRLPATHLAVARRPRRPTTTATFKSRR